MSISLPTYTRREIPLRGRRSRVWAIIATGLRLEIRHPAAMVVIGLGVVIAILSSILLPVLLAAFGPPGQTLGLDFFYTPAANIAVLFFATLLAAVVGGGLIANDVNSMALTLYLSRPLTAADYLTAKAAIVAILIAFLTILPLVLTPILTALLALCAWDVAAEAVGIGILVGFLLTASLTSLSLFLSSLTRRWAYAAAGLFAIIISLFSTAAVLSTQGSINNPALLYLSPWDDYLSVARAAFGVSNNPIDWAVALAILLGVTVLASLATWLRMRAVEVVSG